MQDRAFNAGHDQNAATIGVGLVLGFGGPFGIAQTDPASTAHKAIHRNGLLANMALQGRVQGRVFRRRGIGLKETPSAYRRCQSKQGKSHQL